jgi:hypothetical protein
MPCPSLKVLAATALVEEYFEWDEDRFFYLFFQLLKKVPESAFVFDPLNTLQFVLYHMDPELQSCCHCTPSTEPSSLLRLAFMSSIKKVAIDFKTKINPAAQLCMPRELDALYNNIFIRKLVFSDNLYTYMEEFWSFFYTYRVFN